MRPGHRFIGGPLHGEIRAVRNDCELLSVPVLSYERHYWPCFEGPPATSGLREAVYQRESIGLGNNTRATLYVLRSMTADEKWRRIADLIEGCGVDVEAHRHCTPGFCRRRGDDSCPCR